jgi:hypothetical protein
MWRIERSLLIPVVSVLLIAGLLVPATAAPSKVPRPVWTLTQQYDASDQKVVTLKGAVPSNPKGDYHFFVIIRIGNQCEWISAYQPPICETSGSPCLACTWPPAGPEYYEIYQPYETTNGSSGTGWTIDAELSKSGTLTITVVLKGSYLAGPRQFIDVGVTGLSNDPNVYPTIEASTRLEQAFQ